MCPRVDSQKPEKQTSCLSQVQIPLLASAKTQEIIGNILCEISMLAKVDNPPHLPVVSKATYVGTCQTTQRHRVVGRWGEAMPDTKKHIDKRYVHVRDHVRRRKGSGGGSGIDKSTARMLIWVFTIGMIIYLLTRLPSVYLYIGAALLGAALPLWAYWTWKHPKKSKKKGETTEDTQKDTTDKRNPKH
jgi:hypothetical protein